MNQGKLDVGKQEMARVNINILGISELKWTGMGEFNPEDNYIYYYMQESLRRNGVALRVNKRAWNEVLGCNLKNDNDLSSFLKQINQVYAPTSDTKEAEVDWFHEDLQDLLELTSRKKKKKMSSSS